MLRVTEQEWLEFIRKKEFLELFADPRFLNVIASVQELHLVYFICEYKNEALFGFPVFIKNRKIVVPNHFFYSVIVMDEEANPVIINDAWMFCLAELKKEYTTISFRFSPDVKDIRPFIWNGFSYQLRYTYLFHLHKFIPSSPLKKHITRAKERGVSYDTEYLTSDIFSIQRSDLIRFGFSSSTSSIFEKLFLEWQKNHQMICISAFFNNKRITTQLLLLDKNKKTAYCSILNSAKDYRYLKVHSGLHGFMIEYLKGLGMEQMDFCGANIKEIADFKSKFTDNLQAYYVVNYSRSMEVFRNLRSFIWQSLRKIKNSFS